MKYSQGKNYFNRRSKDRSRRMKTLIVCIKCDVRQPLYNFQKPRPTITKTTGEIKRTCNSCRSGHKKIN